MHQMSKSASRVRQIGIKLQIPEYLVRTYSDRSFRARFVRVSLHCRSDLTLLAVVKYVDETPKYTGPQRETTSTQHESREGEVESIENAYSEQSFTRISPWQGNVQKQSEPIVSPYEVPHLGSSPVLITSFLIVPTTSPKRESDSTIPNKSRRSFLIEIFRGGSGEMGKTSSSFIERLTDDSSSISVILKSILEPSSPNTRDLARRYSMQYSRPLHGISPLCRQIDRRKRGFNWVCKRTLLSVKKRF